VARTGGKRSSQYKLTSAFVCIVLSLATIGTPLSSRAQGEWTGVLILDQCPSPYYSDWEADPYIGRAIITNGTEDPYEVRMTLTVTGADHGVVAVVYGKSVCFGPGETNETIEYNEDLEEEAYRTGLMPEDEYTACIDVQDVTGGFVLKDEVCADFEIMHPEPPQLLYPPDGDSLDTEYPVFQWTPVRESSRCTFYYILRIAEVLAGQVPAEALESNYPHFESFDLYDANLPYPEDALPLEEGKTYAWQVQVLDDKGYPHAANQGKSEIWTFSYRLEPPPETCYLAGTVRDAETGNPIAGADVIYHMAEFDVGGAGDTTWVELPDSLVTLSGERGEFRFDDLRPDTHFSLRARRPDYRPALEIGSGLYLDDNISGYDIRLTRLPPEHVRLAGRLLDFYSNAPVAGAPVVYHAVEQKTTLAEDSTSSTEYVELPETRLETTTGADGRFEFPGASDSSFFSLRASKEPAYSLAQEIGPELYQEGDIDNYILLITPSPCTVTGVAKTKIEEGERPVAEALVSLSRVDTYLNFVFVVVFGEVQAMTVNTTSVPSDSRLTAYTQPDGFFELEGTLTAPDYFTISARSIFGEFVKQITWSWFLDSSYGLSINHEQYHPYEYADSVYLEPGTTVDTGDHFLIAKTGSIAGSVRSAGRGVEGATVYLYPSSAVYDLDASGTSRAIRTGEPGIGEGAAQDQAGRDWTEGDTQKPEGVDLDRVETDGRGRYGFGHVQINDPLQPADGYIIYVEAAGYHCAAKGVRLVEEGDTARVDFRLQHAPGLVYGQVTSLGGTGIGSASVELFDGATLHSRVETDGDGFYTLPGIGPGSYSLKVSKEGYLPFESEIFDVTYGDSLKRDVQLGMAYGSLAITVKEAADPTEGVANVNIRSPDMLSLLAYTDREGKVTLPAVTAGTMRLQFRALGYADKDTTVQVREDETSQVEVHLAKRSGDLQVIVHEKTSGPEKRLANMDVTLGTIGPKTTDGSGEVWFRDAPVGKQKLRVAPPTATTYMDDYVPVETEVQVFEGLNPDPVVVELVPGARLSGKVVAEKDGKAVAGALVRVEGNDQVKDETAGDGTFTLRNVPAGETLTLAAEKPGYLTAVLRRAALEVGEHVTGIEITLQASPLDSIFGFAVVVDSIDTTSGGKKIVTGALVNIPPSFGIKLEEPGARLNFRDVEIGTDNRPTASTITLSASQVDVEVFGLRARLEYGGGLQLEWVDSLGTGRVSGDVIIKDVLSAKIPETQWTSFKLPKRIAPSFHAGGVYRGLAKYGITATATEVQLELKGVKVGIDYNKSHLDTAGFHFYGSLGLSDKITFQFEELLIGKDDDGDVTLKAITIKTDPPVRIPFGVITVVDSSTTWDAAGFRADGAIILNALENRTFGFRNLHISPRGDFLSVTVRADAENGTIGVHGQKFTIKSIAFGTDYWDDPTRANQIYLAFSGQLAITALDKPVEFQNLKYSENGDFTGKIGFNQTKSFKNIVTITLVDIEFGKDEAKGKFVGISGSIKFGAINGLSVQASNLRFYYDGSVSFDEIGFDFIAGPCQVEMHVGYADGVFTGGGMLRVKPVFVVAADFRYGGSDNWYIKIVSGTRIPLGAVEIVELSGELGRQGDTWTFGFGGVIAPARADKGIRLAASVIVNKTPAGVIILGNAEVEIAGGVTVGTATIEINIPENWVYGSITFGYDKDLLKLTAQLDIGLKFGQFWYIYGQAHCDFLKFFTADAVVVVANNWFWSAKNRVMRGIYIEIGDHFKTDQDWAVLEWGIYFERNAKLEITWSGDFAGSISMRGGAYAVIKIPVIDISVASASGDFALMAYVSKTGSAWVAGARADVALSVALGCCDRNDGCWDVCWWWIVPCGIKGCATLHLAIEFGSSGMDIDVSL
jgi:hypothetical protein